MLIYSTAVALYLRVSGGLTGILLWPVVALHGILSLLLGVSA